MLARRVHVHRVVADREQAGVELRVKRLDAPVHDLREAGEVGDRADRDAGRLELVGGAAGRDDLDPELGETAGELDDPGLVGDREQRPRDLDLAGATGPSDSTRWMPCSIPVSDSTGRQALAVGLAGSNRTAPRAISRTASGSSSCSIGCSRSSTSSALAGVRQLDRALQDDRPGVDALVDEVDGDAEDLDAVVDRLLDRVETRERRQQRRMDVDHPVRKAARNEALSSCM